MFRIDPFPDSIRGATGMAIVAIAACGDGMLAGRSSTMVADSAGIQIVTSDPWATEAHCAIGDEPILSIGEREGDAPHIFFQVRAAARLSDGAIAVVDGSSREVRVFAETGAHLVSMGGRGEGPGEFRSSWLLWVLPGDTLWAGDYLPWRFNIFSADGRFVRSMAPEDFTLHTLIPPGGVLDGGSSVNVTQATGGTAGDFANPVNYLVIAHDPDGGVLDTLATLPGKRLGSLPGFAGFVEPLFEASSLVAARSSTVAMTTAREPEVRILDGSFRLRRIIRWADPDRAVTRVHVQAAHEDYIARHGGPGSPGWSAGHDAAISDNRPVADAFPTASDLMIGRDGHLWLKRYARPGEEPSWVAFRADGDFYCHFRPGPELTPLEFGAAYLLALHRDDVGVERVVMYNLTRDSG
ncbi:MAG: hypothetical protein OXN92_12630 [Gammaproteobacteria bacterium]|nr:hypothetical protein [Gammaproteobacteria bacterium]